MEQPIPTDNKNEMQRSFDFDTHMQYEALIGSHAYGTAEPGSKRRYLTIVTPPKLVELAIRPFETWRNTERTRFVHSLRRFGRMLLDCNLAAYEALFVGDEFVRYCGHAGNRLRQARGSLLSLELADRYAGEGDVACDDMFDATREDSESQRLFRRHGYDPKAAARAVRCYRIANEIAKGLSLRVTRNDREELAAIRRGDIPLDELAEFDNTAANQEIANGIIAYERDAYDIARQTCILPETCDAQRLSDLLADISYKTLENYEKTKDMPERTITSGRRT